MSEISHFTVAVDKDIKYYKSHDCSQQRPLTTTDHVALLIIGILYKQ